MSASGSVPVESASLGFARGSSAADASRFVHETLVLDDGGPTATVDLVYRHPSPVERRPTILMLGAATPETVPPWSLGLLDEGYQLAAFQVAHPPDPDPARRPQWLFFDQRFAHGYVEGGARAPGDAARVIDHLQTRADTHPAKFGWMGSSSTAIPGLAVAAREPRLTALVGFVCTGAYRQWLDTWHAHGLWRGETPDPWPETLALLETDDPILHVAAMYPTAVLLVSGGEDKVVDPATAEAFVAAARPYYEGDLERLRHVVYNGFGHNLPADVVRLYAEHWFRLYMHPTHGPPPPARPPGGLEGSVERTRINTTDHKDILRAE